ncbi:MAG: hypothetical protein FH753_17560 [Firmicutes bacterium]|nr:hypothetical protein [Bacillota bacterium]
MFKNERGATYVVTVLAMTVILGFFALVTDVGLTFIERRKLSNAADSAALAGALELPTDPDKALNVANEYLNKNNVSLDSFNISVSEDNSKIEVDVLTEVQYYFAKVLGMDSTDVASKAKALVGPVSKVYDGIRPLVVEDQTFEYGERFILKEDGGDGYNGNYGAVALGGTGASNFRYNIKFGYKGKLEVGDIIDTETGNMAGPTRKGINYITDSDYSTFENFTKDSLRLWTIPIVDSLAVDGREEVKIVGFALFFMEDAQKSKGQLEIVGRFIEFTTNGDISEGQTDYGLKGVKLTH